MALRGNDGNVNTDAKNALAVCASDLRTLDPAYRVFFEGAPGESRPPRLDIGADTADNVAAFEAIEPGAGEALSAYIESARDAYDIALRHFLYTNFTSPTA